MFRAIKITFFSILCGIAAPLLFPGVLYPFKINTSPFLMPWEFLLNLAYMIGCTLLVSGGFLLCVGICIIFPLVYFFPAGHPFWRYRCSVSLGFILGGLLMATVVTYESSGSVQPFSILFLFLLGAFYGSFTALGTTFFVKKIKDDQSVGATPINNLT